MQKKQAEHLALLQKTVLGIENLNKKLDEVIRKQEAILHLLGKKEGKPDKKPVYENKLSLDVMTLLSLSDHLRKTATTIFKLGRATAEDIAKYTGRGRAVESSYLNQLVAMGYLKKERQVHEVYFHL